MNRGFIFYFKRALKCANKTTGGLYNRAKCLAYVFMSLFARLTVVLCAFSSLMGVRQAKIARDRQTVNLPKTLGFATGKSFLTVLAATALEALIFLGGLAVLALPCGAVFGLGYAIAQMLNAGMRTAVMAIFAVPCAVAVLFYIAMALAVFSPTAYVVDSNPGLRAGEVIAVCFATMKRRGKLTALMCYFVPTALITLILAVFGSGLYTFIALFGGQSYCALICVVWAIAMAVIMFFTAPLLVTVKNLSLLYLCEDIALDPENAAKHGEGAVIKSISGARLDSEAVADGLYALFDDSLEERTVSSDKLKRKHPPKVRVAEEKAKEEEYDLSDIDEYADERVVFDEKFYDGYDFAEEEESERLDVGVYENSDVGGGMTAGKEDK